MMLSMPVGMRLFDGSVLKPWGYRYAVSSHHAVDTLLTPMQLQGTNAACLCWSRSALLLGAITFLADVLEHGIGCLSAAHLQVSMHGWWQPAGETRAEAATGRWSQQCAGWR